MTEILVVANRTLGGEKLLDLARSRAQSVQDVSFRLVVPQIKPTAGLVIYDEAVRESAQIRVDLALTRAAQEGMRGQRRNRRPRPVPGDDGRDRRCVAPTRSSSPPTPRPSPDGCDAI